MNYVYCRIRKIYELGGNFYWNPLIRRFQEKYENVNLRNSELGGREFLTVTYLDTRNLTIRMIKVW